MLDIRALLAGLHQKMCGETPLTNGIDRNANTPDYEYLYDLVAVHQAQGEGNSAIIELLKKLRSG